MTKNECIKEIKKNVYGRSAYDLFIRLSNVVSDYQTSGEDNCLDGVLDYYMSEEDACGYIQQLLEDDNLCIASKSIRDLREFSGVYRTDGYGWLEDVDHDEVDSLRDEVLDRLGYDPEIDYEDEDDEE